MARSQNTQGANVVSISDERPELATMGKTPDGRFVGEKYWGGALTSAEITTKGAGTLKMLIRTNIKTNKTQH